MEGYNALSVANELIAIARDEGEYLTPLKLQKLLYFTHGYHWGIYDAPAIRHGFEAWPYGPVSREVYSAYAEYQSSPITQPIWRQFIHAAPRLSLTPGSDSVRNIAQRVWATFGKFSAVDLSMRTHVDGSPWARIKQSHPDLSASDHIEIPEQAIRDYFQGIIGAAR